MSLKVGMVGATGMVGETFFSLIEDRDFPFSELRAFASPKSKGKQLQIKDQTVTLDVLHEGCFNGLDVVFFSSGDDISLEWAPKAVAAGAYAIDNSAAFRMNPDYPLVVPEINADQIPGRGNPTIVANPNCSTIQLVMALAPLKKFGLQAVRVATYQAVSGAGKAAQQELLDQVEQLKENPSAQFSGDNFAHPIAYNCLPHIGSFNDQGFCSEEMKIMKETRKILGLPKLKTSAFTVRVPALNGHAEAAWVTLDKEVSKEEILETLKSFAGLEVIEQDRPENYPHHFQLKQAEKPGQSPVYVGRLHQDFEDPNTWIMWVVADNIRKGAALNGLQIAESIFC